MKFRTFRTFVTLALFALSVTLPGLATAAPRQRSTSQLPATFDTPGWITSSGAASLAVGINVLVPGDIPAPFSGEPSISASDGYYNLYWLVTGSAPTFLSITGESGGSIPAYSKYDRNVQLTVNASVNGAGAYHDLTPIYDLVYWQVGNVVYSVESRNMTGTDSLSLANSLVTLTAPAPPEPTPTPPPTPTPTAAVDSNGSSTGGNSSNGANSSGNGGGSSVGTDSNGAGASGNSGNGSGATGTDANGSNALTSTSGAAIDAPSTIDMGTSADITVSGSNGYTLKADAGIFTATGRDSILDVANAAVQWEAPSPSADQTVTFTLVSPDTGDVFATAQTTVSIDPNRVLTCPASTASSKVVTVQLRGSGTITLKADMGTFPSDGANANFGSNGGSSLSGAMPDSGEVKLTWKAPDRKTDGTANLTATGDNGTSVGACAIKVAKLAVKATTIPKPAKTTTIQKSDGTDLRITGPGSVNPEPSVVSTAFKSVVDDGSGIIPPVTPQPGSVPTPVPTKAPPAPAKTSTPNIQPTATLAPTLDNSGMVSQVIGPDGGQLSCPSGATITIPAGALAQAATVTLRPVANSKLPSRSTVDLVPGTAFDISVASIDGRSIDVLSKPAEFRIALGSDKWRSGTTLYAIDGIAVVPLSNVTLNGDSVSAPIASLSRYAAGVPVKSTLGAKRSIARVVMAGAAMAFFVSVGALAFKVWLGRKSTMTVGPRRLR